MSPRHLTTLFLLLHLYACATTPPPTQDGDQPVWAVKRTLVRSPRPSTLAPPPPQDLLPAGDALPPLRPALLANTYPMPEDLKALGAGELEIYALNLRETLRVTLFTPRGVMLPDAAQELAWIFRDHREEVQHPMDPRLLTLLYLVAQVYRRPLVLISGYREPRRRTSRTSRHAAGKAADIRVPGVSSEDLSLLIKSYFEGVGVGIYPSSDFVHVDVRESSYYWVDHSGPGEAKREAALELDPLPPRNTDWTRWSQELPPAWHY